MLLPADMQESLHIGEYRLLQLAQQHALLPLALEVMSNCVGTIPHALQFLWKPGEEALVASLVLDLFHLLPRAAVKFLETHQGPAPAAAAAAGAGAAAGGATPAGDKPAAAAGGPADPSASTKLGLVILTIQLEEKLTALNSPVGRWATRKRTACRAR